MKCHVSPKRQEAWSDSFYWQDIVRTCFKAGGFLEQDEFTNQREESDLIPMEATGASELMGELAHCGLFPTELLLEAMQHEGTLYCHPKP